MKSSQIFLQGNKSRKTYPTTSSLPTLVGEETESDNWPEPDHRYTHLGPGRGKASRQLSAVNQLGFAGGGLSRPFGSAVLPAVKAAGGGTIGRVMPVPEGLAAAAAASVNGIGGMAEDVLHA